MYRTSYLGSLGVLSLVCAMAWAPPARSTEVVKMGDLPSVTNIPLYVGMEKGFFAEQGIAVSVENFTSGGKMVAPLATGQIEVGIGSPTAGLFNSVAQGMDFKIVADKGQQRTGYSNFLLVRQDLLDSGKVRTIRDLKGMKLFGGPAKGHVVDYIIAKMLESEGLSPSDVDTVYISYPDAFKALTVKAVAAGIAPEPWGARAEEQKVGTRFFLTEKVQSVNTFQVGVIMFSGKFIKERPKIARDFLRAYVKAIQYHNARGYRDAEISAIAAKYTKVPVETVHASIPAWFDPDGRPRIQDLDDLQTWFHSMGWVTTKIPIERIVDVSLLPAAGR